MFKSFWYLFPDLEAAEIKEDLEARQPLGFRSRKAARSRHNELDKAQPGFRWFTPVKAYQLEQETGYAYSGPSIRESTALYTSPTLPSLTGHKFRLRHLAPGPQFQLNCFLGDDWNFLAAAAEVHRSPNQGEGLLIRALDRIYRLEDSVRSTHKDLTTDSLIKFWGSWQVYEFAVTALRTLGLNSPLDEINHVDLELKRLLAEYEHQLIRFKSKQKAQQKRRGAKRKSQPGPQVDLELERQFLQILRSFGRHNEWQKKLGRVCAELDRQGIPAPSTWTKKDPPAANWKQGNRNHAKWDNNLVLKALQTRLKRARERYSK